ncbi:kinesin-like protein KIN-7O isoform X2 [Aristolochia californica]|uniref:kinesin-like protein KIN-7O isoform X2 n=1 Tax=Aristolochia californica TaxID=171875 RepID=UPI0035D903D0
MERIHVSVRARPISPEDARTSPWRISVNSISNTNQSLKYEFDRIFGEECRTRDVYEAQTKKIVAAAVGGFNGTIFAYGQTSSGKTYTMRGSKSEPGVIPLAVQDLFHFIQKDADREFLLRMSYMEIYNEEINDLLAPEHRKLQIHESLERGIYVAGLQEEIVSSAEQVLDFMEFGESHRHIGETNMNVYSSRSHTIFRMIIESRDRIEEEGVDSSCDAVRVSVLNLVDLAGSERAAKTGAEGVRLKEGSHINKSLMTLGTVINKLSEGVESQGGHVPYRDSKLTRILQPSLGGNANTAIICNITLAQILTDAALLKRQKKEIEELRAKLMGSNSDHFEEEILNLRNTLLQTELERERISLELQEEKKAQAQRERRLQEQAKQIANLSSMVLNTKRDVNDNHSRKNKRRQTWCPTVLSMENLNVEVPGIPNENIAREPDKEELSTNLLIPFEELENESNAVSGGKPSNFSEDQIKDFRDDCDLPYSLLKNITNRRKVPSRKTTSASDDVETTDIQSEYENLLISFETQRTTKDIEIECLKNELAKAECHSYSNGHVSLELHPSTEHEGRGVKGLTVRESEAILVIKHLQEQIEKIETEKFSVQANLDNVVQLATEQKILDSEKYDKLHQELLNAREEAQVACEQLRFFVSTGASDEVEVNFLVKLTMEVQAIEDELHQSRDLVQSISSVVDDLLQSFSFMMNTFLDFKSLSCAKLKSNEETYNSMKEKVTELEVEKLSLHRECFDHLEQIEDLKTEVQNFKNALKELHQQKELENEEFVSQIQILQKEISCLSTSSVAREKESLRKDLEKTKMKLKDTETRLKSSIQDKIKLESEKAYAEREIKLLQGQMTLLERDISKRDSVSNKRRESLVVKRREAQDLSKTKAQNTLVEHNLQLKVMELDKANVDLEILSGEYQNLEAFAIEMEGRISVLEEDLLSANNAKEEALVRNEDLSLELESTSTDLTRTKSELDKLLAEVSCMSLKLRESETLCKKLEISVKILSEEKEEMAMQLTNALLEFEEEKVSWSMREKATVASITEKAKLSEAEIVTLSQDLLEVRNELELFREDCRTLCEKLTLSEENAKYEKQCSIEKSKDIDQLRSGLHKCEMERENDTAKYNEENEKLRQTLHSTQAKLETYKRRYRQALDELKYMDSRYEAASAELKDKLRSAGTEILRLKKLLVEGTTE